MIDVYDDWNEDGLLEPLKTCPFCGGKALLSDNGYEEPIIDEDGCYRGMDIFEGDIFWCQCSECGANTRSNRDLEKAIEIWNTRKVE